MSPNHTTRATGTDAAPMGDEALAAIAARLPVSGLFIAHAHTDVTRLLAEVHRLRHALTNRPHPTSGDGRPDHLTQGANR